MANSTRSTPVVGSSSLTFLAFAMPAAMFGVMWPDVRDRFDQSLGALGIVSLVYGLSRMSTSGSGRAATARFGIGPCFVAAIVGLVAADLLVGVASTWAMFLVGVASVGIVSGLLDSVGAGVVATLGDVGRAGLIHGSYGVGATIGPLAVALVPDWRWSLVVAAAFAGSALLVAAAVGEDWPAPPRVDDGDGPIGRPPRRATLLSLAVFATFVAVEVTMGNWLFTYLTEARSIGDGVAAIGVSGFWGGTTLGRLLLASSEVRRRTQRFGLVGFGAAAVAFAITMSVAPGPAVVVVASATGLSLAPLVPTLSAQTAARVGVTHAQRVSGWQLLAANVGAIGVPAATGFVVDRTDASVVIVIVIGVLVVGLAPLVAMKRLTREIATESQPPS